METAYVNLQKDNAGIKDAFSKFHGINVEKYEYDSTYELIHLYVNTEVPESKIQEFCNRYDMLFNVCTIDRFNLSLRLQYPNFQMLQDDATTERT